ncbi:MAG TPA: class I SAM-dependent methyltransferase [Gemmatimonadaceae bacterium]|nr:class I SAM-dependent methyltransferase [Gemmatimonadaceae bacterium]
MTRTALPSTTRPPHPRMAGAGLAHDVETPDVHTASASYRNRFVGGGRLALLRQAEGVTRALRATGSAPLSVLDVGGGHAQLTGALQRAGHRVVVHGSTEACFQWIQPLAAAAPQQVTPCVARLLALPFATGAFDLVCGIRLLAHVSEWRALLAEMARVSRRFLLLDFPLDGGMQRLSGPGFRLKRTVEKNTRPFFLYRRTDVVSCLATVDVQPVLSFGELVLPLALHRALHLPRLSLLAERALAGMGLGDRIGSPVLLLGEKRVHGRTDHAMEE